MDFISENRAALHAHFGGLMRTDRMNLAAVHGRLVLTDLWIRMDLLR
jgi:hypothetical protein